MDCLTFLNDKKINGELYAYLQELSVAVGRECYRMTIVKKDSLPTQSVMCEKLGIKSPKTLRTHIDYLKQMGYIIEDDEGNYVLPEKEDIFLMLPLDTLKYLNNNCRDHVIKIYVYLGQRFKMASSEFRQYEFTLQEIGEHIGIKVKNNSNGYGIVNNALELLYNSGLIDYCSYYDGKMQKKKLTKFSTEYKKKR